MILSAAGIVPGNVREKGRWVVIRLFFASLFGGLAVFMGGFVGHMILNLVARTQSEFPNETAAVEAMKQLDLPPGLYRYPQAPKDLMQLPEKEMTAKWNELNERFKSGTNGILIVGPKGQEMMGPRELGGEALSNVLAAFLAGWIVLQMRGSGFFKRWFAVIVMSLLVWVSMNASYVLWYRFPVDFMLDELYCSLLEWTAGGLVIAAICVPAPVPKS